MVKNEDKAKEKNASKLKDKTKENVKDISKEKSKTNIDVSVIEPIDKVGTSIPKVNKNGKNLGLYIAVGIASFVFTLVLSAQLNTVGNTDIISQGLRETELLNELTKYKEELENLKEDYAKSQEIVEEYKSNASNNDALIKSITTELDAVSILAGLSDLKGEGVVINLYDSTSPSVDLSIEAGLVHDTDLVAVITELKAAGAEAISINGQRIIATTAIRCVGPTIQINSVKVAAPYTIKAIGNAQYLESALNIKGGIVSSLRSYGITIEITRQTNIEISKYDGTLKFKVAQVVNGK